VTVTAAVQVPAVDHRRVVGRRRRDRAGRASDRQTTVPGSPRLEWHERLSGDDGRRRFGLETDGERWKTKEQQIPLSHQCVMTLSIAVRSSVPRSL